MSRWCCADLCTGASGDLLHPPSQTLRARVGKPRAAGRATRGRARACDGGRPGGRGGGCDVRAAVPGASRAPCLHPQIAGAVDGVELVNSGCCKKSVTFSTGTCKVARRLVSQKAACIALIFCSLHPGRRVPRGPSPPEPHQWQSAAALRFPEKVLKLRCAWFDHSCQCLAMYSTRFYWLGSCLIKLVHTSPDFSVGAFTPAAR